MGRGHLTQEAPNTQWRAVVVEVSMCSYLKLLV